MTSGVYPRGPRGPYRRRSVHDRIMSKVIKHESGCWLFTGRKNRNGYADFNVGAYYGARWVPVHRALYEILVGPVPDGLVLDHLCRVPLCVNPEHLEPVTQRTNLLRSPLVVKEICRNGHRYADYTIRWRKGKRGLYHRVCGACYAKARERESARRRAARLLVRWIRE